MIHVMRAACGRRVTLFDGSGQEWTAEVRRLGRAEVELQVLAGRLVDRELPVEVTLASALPKGERQKWLVEKLVELGVARLIPLQTARGVAQPGQAALERLRRGVIEASKQCGRNRLMEITPPKAWSDLLASTANVPQRWIAHPGDAAGGEGTRREMSSPRHRVSASPRVVFPPAPLADRIVLAVGPEGGFTSDELTAAATAGWERVDLGNKILRVETAAIFLAALVAARASL